MKKLLSTQNLMLHVLAGVIATLLVTILFAHQTTALSGSEFRAGNIIDNAVFYNSVSMTPQQIQAFLDSKVPTCDTNGDQLYNSTQTRAQWAAANGRPLPPYTCVKDYSQTVQPIVNGGSDLCTQSISGGVKTAAQIIYDVAQACGINPQTLLVLLQKEQALITDTWPWPRQYEIATGYGCPDTAACNAEYYGFFNQVYQAAKAYQRYEANPNSYNFKANRNNYIQYNPNTACGGSTVYVENQATASLYIYTPYQPNAAALNNLYGSGDGCSAYGNRNFWRMFNDWFGSTQASHQAVRNGVTTTINTLPPSSPAVGQSIDYVVTFTNKLTFEITFDAIGAVGRIGHITNGKNRDFGWQGPVTLAPGASQQFTFSTTLSEEGVMYVWPAIFYQGNFLQYNNWGSTLVVRTPNISFSGPLTIDSNTVHEGQDVTFSATLKNNEPHAITYNALGIPVRFYNKYNYDATWVGPGTIAPGGEIVLSGIRTIDKDGPYTYWVAHLVGDRYSSLGQSKTFEAQTVTPTFSVSGLSFTNPSPALGENISASFTVTNNLPVSITVDAVGVVGRYGTFSGPNRDIGWQGPVTFAAGETRAFSGLTRAVSEAGTHYYWIGILHQGRYTQYNNWGSTVVSKTPDFSVSGLSLSSTSPSVNDALTASFTVTNNLPVSITVDAVGVVGRYGTFSGPNRDIGWQGPVTFAAGETRAFSGYSKTIVDTGVHYYWVGVFDEGSFIQYNNWGSTVVSSP